MHVQVLIEFPCELVSAVVAGRWAASSSPLKPWLFGYQARLVMAAVVTAIVRSLIAPALLSLFLIVLSMNLYPHVYVRTECVSVACQSSSGCRECHAAFVNNITHLSGMPRLLGLQELLIIL